MKNLAVFMATGLLSIGMARADICADLGAIHTQSQSHFDGWKKEGAEGAAGKEYDSNFLLDGARSCAISRDSAGYSCIWRFATPAELGQAYQRMVGEIKACQPLLKQAPGIISDKPEERIQGNLRRTMEVTGFDYGDAGVVVMLGQMQITSIQSGTNVSRNELKFSFVRAAARP
ncbi:vesicle formation protein [Herbaspirillum sp.]|uniref:vesicle formation protein n=1 Tax=Herbaspirillum sp. TaxID=1890675 RepID=UPI0025BD97A6|nr:vesicle formation protein [Herbaspirillum sp.]